MKKISIILVSCLIAVTSSHAELQALDNNALQAVEGQAGADLSLKLSLNQNILSDAALQAGTAPTFSCTNLEYCRLAISFNKRFVQKKLRLMLVVLLIQIQSGVSRLVILQQRIQAISCGWL